MKVIVIVFAISVSTVLYIIRFITSEIGIILIHIQYNFDECVHTIFWPSNKNFIGVYATLRCT